MKICFYCDSIFTFGGVQRVVAVLAKALSANHSVTILTMDDPSIEDMGMYELGESTVQIDYFAYPDLPSSLRFINRAYSFLYKKLPIKNKLTTKLYSRSSYPKTYRKLLTSHLNSGEYDVIIGVHAFISMRLAIIRHDLQSDNVIGWMHTSYEAFFSPPGLYLSGQKKQFQYEMPKLDNIVVLSESDKRQYERKMNLATTVIYNPLTLEAHGKGDKSFKVFLAVGRLIRAKGFDILIKSFAEFAKHNKEWQLYIVGEGPEEKVLSDLILENGLSDRVFIYPFTKEIQKYYTSVSVFVLSSRWEGWGLVMCEAMVHALPVIASDLPVVKELLDGKANSLIFESENIKDLTQKLVSIIDLDLDAMGEESVEIAKRFSLPTVIRQWEDIFSHN